MAAQPSSQSSRSLLFLQEKSDSLASQFQRNYPELAAWIQENQLLNISIQPAAPIAAPQPKLDELEKKLMLEITQEEHQSIMQKMQDLVSLPATQLESELELYLEQQLSDLLGFTVTAELDGHRLPFTSGTIQSLPYYKTSPTDSAEEHTEVKEAPFSAKRSFFGWNSLYHQEIKKKDSEKYGVAIPLFALPNWNENAIQLKKWFAFRSVIIINPLEYTAVVASITDVYIPTSAKYKFGGSPSLIRAGKLWSPQTQGKVLIFFVSDESTPNFGPLSLEYQE